MINKVIRFEYYNVISLLLRLEKYKQPYFPPNGLTNNKYYFPPFRRDDKAMLFENTVARPYPSTTLTQQRRCKITGFGAVVGCEIWHAVCKEFITEKSVYKSSNYFTYEINE